MVTELRLLAVPAIIIAVAYRAFGTALLLFVAAGVSDGLDGWLARRTGGGGAAHSLDAAPDSPHPSATRAQVAARSLAAADRPQGQSRLGEYLDPIADKALVSSLFIALAVVGAFPWLLTIIVITRDLSILIAALWIYWTTGFRDFRPTMVGKVNTVIEIATIGLALFNRVYGWTASVWLEHLGWVLVFCFAYGSGIHYAFTCAHRYHAAQADRRPRAA